MLARLTGRVSPSAVASMNKPPAALEFYEEGDEPTPPISTPRAKYPIGSIAFVTPTLSPFGEKGITTSFAYPMIVRASVLNPDGTVGYILQLTDASTINWKKQVNTSAPGFQELTEANLKGRKGRWNAPGYMNVPVRVDPGSVRLYGTLENPVPETELKDAQEIVSLNLNYRTGTISRRITRMAKGGRRTRKVSKRRRRHT